MFYQFDSSATLAASQNPNRIRMMTPASKRLLQQWANTQISPTHGPTPSWDLALDQARYLPCNECIIYFGRNSNLKISKFCNIK